MTDEYYDRAAIHAHIHSDDVPSDVRITDQDTHDRTAELVYHRDSDDYRALERFQGEGVLYLQVAEPRDHFEDALRDAIDYARANAIPLQRTVFAWTLRSSSLDPGAARLPRPWLNPDGIESQTNEDSTDS
ncbi:hypothetical protein [Halobacterium yunchengense]|uniref:hypothetical protein n=1 Tax=Halobacterium yunchengense TaxID=3108497 RepID=UPI003009E81C